MNSVTVKPSSILLQLHSSFTDLRHSCKPDLRFPSVKFPGRNGRSKGRLSFGVTYHDSSIEEGESELPYVPYLPFGTLSDSKEDVLLASIEKNMPEFVKSYLEGEPLLETVVPIRDNTKDLLRKLPPHHFEGEYSSVAKLSTLFMYTGMILGLHFQLEDFTYELELIMVDRHKQVKREKRIATGDADTGKKRKKKKLLHPFKTAAKWYLQLLAAEIEAMNRQIGEKTADEPNELLEYLKSLEPEVKELISSGEDYYLEDMKRFIEVFLEVFVKSPTVPEISNLLCSMMVVGYKLHIAAFHHKY